MNIYLVTEDGESFCIKAKTMAEALEICEISYLDDRRDETEPNFSIDYERKYYHEQILQSCALVAELKN